MNMKKTLIALAVAASAAVSGSAMAWTNGNFNGSLEIGGTLTPSQTQNPWEVAVGANMDNLNGSMIAGNAKTSINVNSSISILGIRTVANTAFNGEPGLSPQITYANNVIDFSKAKAGVGVMTLDVKDDNDAKIGTLTTPVYAGAAYSSAKPDGTESKKGSLYANVAGNGFFGGLPEASSQVDAEPWVGVAKINPEYTANFDEQNAATVESTKTAFASRSFKYSGFYGAGIVAGSKLDIKLDAPIQVDTKWKASLPITVSYQ